MTRDPEEIAAVVVDRSFRLHKEIGPGLLESTYEALLADILRDEGFDVECQQWIDLKFRGRRYERVFRADMIVYRSLLLEIKSIDRLAPVHIKQTLTYIRILNMPLGMLLNFGGAIFKDGVRRVMNDRSTI